MDLISLDDFAAAGGDPESPAATFAMADASEQVRGYLNQQVDYVAGDVATLVGTGTRALLLPELPVIEITSVTINGEVIDPAGYRFADGVLWRRTTTIHDDYGCSYTATWPRDAEVVVDYSHGWTEIPADIRGATARKAATIAASSTTSVGAGLTLASKQETIQDYSYTESYSSDDAASASTGGAGEFSSIAHRVVRRVPVA